VALEHHHVEAVPREEARAAEAPEPAPDHHHVRLRPLRNPERRRLVRRACLLDALSRGPNGEEIG
jgi:hypothetical protein